MLNKKNKEKRKEKSKRKKPTADNKSHLRAIFLLEVHNT